MTASRAKQCIALCAIALGIFACARNTDFLHHVLPQPLSEETVGSYYVKDIVGGSMVDVIWVIDNSGSMYDDQQIIIANTALFMDEFTKKNNIDWKMGLLSTDTDNVPYVGFDPLEPLNTHTANPVPVFQDAVSRLGTGGDIYEKFYDPIEKAITDYPKFLRPHAALALIHVSDAPEQSMQSTQQFLDFLAKQKNTLKRVLGYGVLWPQEWCTDSSGDDSFYLAGSRYEEFFGAVKGKTYALCRKDFGKDLADLGKSIVNLTMSPRIPLTKRPRPKSIRVVHKGVDLPGGLKEEGGFWLYDFDLNAILFHDLDFAPGDQEEVQVIYREDNGV